MKILKNMILIINDIGEEFSDMSDEDLRREVERLKNQTGGDYFAKMGKMKALQNELESRK